MSLRRVYNEQLNNPSVVYSLARPVDGTCNGPLQDFTGDGRREAYLDTGTLRQRPQGIVFCLEAQERDTDHGAPRLDELLAFQAALTWPLKSVCDLLASVDPPLARAAGESYAQAQGLIQRAADTVRRHVQITQQLNQRVLLLDLKLSMKEEESDMLMQLLSSILVLAKSMRRDVEHIQRAYVSLDKGMRNLITCTELAVEGLGTSPGGDPCDKVRSSAFLQLALQQLESALNILQGKSVFWESVHNTMAMLTQMEETIGHLMLRVSTTPLRESPLMDSTLESIWGHLRLLDQQFCF
mmetsp:Transcript_120999/g.337669  ORF Transcript_120999/g.337669 Transcript_120999/m.337669 type:complete len:297 (-) Transcript_120999:125-1015(-)